MKWGTDMPKIHLRDIRLRVNAGIDMPVCYAAQQGPLDLDKSHLPTTGERDKATCKHCKRAFAKRYPWASG